MKYNNKTQLRRREKTGNANGKMGGLNNGNKGPFPMLSELFSVLTNVNLKCIRVSGTGFDSNTRYIYFYLRVELGGWLSLTIYGNLCISEYLAARSITF